MAKLKAKLTEEPGAGLEDYYVKQQDGASWLLDVESVDGLALEDVGGLKDSLSASIERRKKALDRLEEFGDLSPQDVKELEAKYKKALESGDEDKIKQRVQDAVEQVQAKHAGEKGKWGEREKALMRQVRRHLLEATADGAISEFAADKAAAKLLRPHVLNQLEMKEENGEFSVVVLGADGNPRLSMESGNNGPMSVREFVGSMKNDEDFALAFRGTGASGAGSRGSTGTARSGDTYTISSADAKDATRYRQAKAAAEKAGRQLVITD